MYTLLFPPLCTLMLPEPETISRSTAPETCNVRSKVPVSEAWSGSVTTAANSPATARSLRDFILFLLKGQPKFSLVHVKTQGPPPVCAHCARADHGMTVAFVRCHYCNTTCSPSFNPLSSSVLEPLEMPTVTAIFFLPSLAAESGISTDALRSLS